MQGIKVEGIILKRRNLGEADRILTVFTLQKGKISVLAKGVRRITSRRSGNVELLNRVFMYLHPARTFLILTEAESLDTYPNLKKNLTLSASAFGIIELVDKMTADNQESRQLYGDLIEVLNRLSLNPRQIYLRAFEVKILSAMGFATFQTNLDSDLSKYPQVSIQIHPKGGRELLARLETLTWDEIEKIHLNQNQALELEAALRYHIERVLEGRLKSKQFLKKI